VTPNFDCRNNIATSHALNLTMIFKEGEEVFETFNFTNTIADVKFKLKGIISLILMMQNRESRQN
jgi:hypothetical protein